MKNFLNWCINLESSPHKLALSVSFGLFIAFSPFIGFHNIMVLVFSWMFNLNTLVTFTVSHINNPITVAPVITFCYLFGKWLLHDAIGITLKYANPEWINYINMKLTYYLGMPKICFWTFFIGANILGLFFAILFYPIMKLIFKNSLTKNIETL